MLLACDDASGPDSLDRGGPVSFQPGTFQRIFGTGASEYGVAIRPTPDGGYLMVGKTGLAGKDLVVLRTDPSGRPMQENPRREIYGSISVRDVVATPDGGMAVMMVDHFVLLLKYDADGALEWKQEFEQINNFFISGIAMTGTPDGGYLIVGGGDYTGNDAKPYHVIKVDSEGETEWESSIDAARRDIVAVDVTQSGEFVVAGTMFDDVHASDDIWVGMLDASGHLVWEKTFGDQQWDVARDIVALESGFAVAGDMGDVSLVLRATEDGDEMWSNTYVVRVRRMLPMPDGGLVIAGGRGVTGEGAYFARLTPGGDVTWLRSFGRSPSDEVLAVAVLDDGFVLAGRSADLDYGDDDILLVRTDRNGFAPPYVEDRRRCPDPDDPSPPQPPPPPVARDWTLARGPATWGTLNAFAEGGSGDVFAVSSTNVFRFSGGMWRLEDVRSRETLRAIAALDDDYVVAVGTGTTALHYDGTSWELRETNVGPEFLLYWCVWGSSRNNVLAGASGGTIARFDGSTWSEMDTGVSRDIESIWGSAPNDVWAVCYPGTLLHYDGNAWTTAHVHDGSLARVWGSAGDDVYAIGSAGAILHFDGDAWTPVDVTTADLLTISGRAADDIYVAGRTLRGPGSGVIYHFDGASWRDITAEVPPDPSRILAASGGRMFVTNLRSGKLHWFDGAVWITEPDRDEPLLAVWALDDDYAVAVGDNGSVVRWDGAAWQTMVSGTDDRLTAVWGFDRDNVVAAAWEGAMFHFDGVTWTRLTSTANRVRNLWGSAPRDVYAAGEQLVHYDGSEWTDVTPKGTYRIYDLWGQAGNDIFAIDAGDVYHFDGCTWDITRRNDWWLGTMCAMPGPLVLFGGDSSRLLRFDGVTWDDLDTGLGNGAVVTSLWGRGPDDVFVIGSSPESPVSLETRHFDGTSWTRLPLLTVYEPIEAHGTAGGTVFIVGDGGTVVQGTPR